MVSQGLKAVVLSELGLKKLFSTDNIPLCPIPELEVVLEESVGIGTYVTTMEAHDADISASIPTFSISGEGAEDLRIDSETGVITTRNLLDRESQLPVYSLTVHASDEDAGAECRTSLRVVLEDVNDNEPKFTEEVYRLTVKEDGRVGSVIGSVLAYDADLGMNRRIRYVLVSAVAEGETQVESQFALDPSTGMISLLRPLDRELISYYNLTVKATDSGSPPLSATALVSITVADVNDNPPEFFSSYYSSAVSEVMFCSALK